MTKEQAFEVFVEQYDIEVPEARVENEYQYFLLQTKHNMQYDTLTTGAVHRKAEELEELEEELRAAAYREAKTDLVVKELFKQQTFPVTEEDRQAKAAQIMAEEGSSLDMLHMFFGDDLSGLDRGIQEDKLKEWVLQQMDH